MEIIWKGSPNKDSNRKPIDRVLIHWFGSGTLESANSRFQNPSTQVSAHYGISDNTIYQWVDESDVAYHAGNYEMNQRSIGIEHDATTTKPMSEETYKTASQLLSDICNRYGIPLDREHIIGHKEVKATQCPGTIDIDKLISMAKGLNDPCKEIREDRDYQEKEKEKYKTEARSSRGIIEQQVKEIKGKQEHIDSLQKSNAELTAQLQSNTKEISNLRIENKYFRDDSVALQATIKGLTEDLKLADERNMKLVKETQDKAVEIDELNKKLKQKLKSFPRWDLIKAVIFR